MKLTAITVQKSQLEFALDEAFTGALALTEYAPVIHGDERVVAKETLTFASGKAVAARFDGSHDPGSLLGISASFDAKMQRFRAEVEKEIIKQPNTPNDLPDE